MQKYGIRWDEMGKFDIPAVLNFILFKTERKNLIYIGKIARKSAIYLILSSYMYNQSSFVDSKGILWDAACFSWR